MEWSGFNNRLACEHKARKKPASTYMFGPLIDAKASHPDSVLTSLEYLRKSLTEMGMSYIQISVDLQLYMVACQIKWNDPDRFGNVILRPQRRLDSRPQSIMGNELLNARAASFVF